MWLFFKYELKAWLKAPLPWILLLINSLLVMGAVSSDNIQIGGGIGSVLKNAPSVVQTFYAVFSVLGLLITTAFMNGTALRDFESGMESLVFASPIKKYSYFFGKFLGGYLVSLIPLFGVSIGVLIGPLMPWAPAERYGDVLALGHWQGILHFALPNTLFGGVLMFALAMKYRSAMVSWIGAMLILVLLSISGGLSSELENESFGSLLDPFGSNAMEVVGKYRTVDEQNASGVPLTGDFMLNRLVWTGISLLLLGFLYTRFTMGMSESKQKKPKTKSKAADQPSVTNYIPKRPESADGFVWSSFWQILKFEYKSVVRHPTFIILLVLGAINLITSLVFFTDGYGLKSLPVTYKVIDSIQGSFYLFLIAIIVFYSGALVWKERDAHIDEIKDVTPFASGMYFSAKILALIGAVASVLALNSVIGMLSQIFRGFFDLKPEVYFLNLLVMDLLKMGHLIVLSVFFHYLLNNRYLAYFVFILVIVLNTFIWNLLEIDSNMLSFGATSSLVYSDMNGYGPYVSSRFWFHLYWFLFCVLLAYAAYGFFIRGRETGFKFRARMFSARMRELRPQWLVVLLLFLGTVSFVYYNTQILNDYEGPKEAEKMQKDYELTYKKYESLPKLKYTDVNFDLDLYPERRDLHAKVELMAYNPHAFNLKEVHFTLPSFSDSVIIHVEQAKMEKRDDRLQYRIFKFEPPLKPGDTVRIQIENYVITKGFENRVSNTSITQNGSFFNHADIIPAMGYEEAYEISDKNKRKKLGLPVRRRMPKLNENDSLSRNVNYIGGDWVNMRTRISTSAGQTAVAPGSLIQSKTENGRSYFEYELDHKAVMFFSFISAKYEVVRENWNGIDLEVYYIADHAYNVKNMLESMRKSLAYYTENFGPYKHKQARIIEFPRYNSFAQAFAGTMPYSESIGFIYDLRDVKESDIDMVFYVVAHEMGHQWWAHQLIGARMQGSEMLSETFAQYSALMVMEKTYGRDRMKKFLKYEMDEYLSGRSSEFIAERPMIGVESQGYIHYRKGSVVMYYLKEMIGEQAVNQALRSLIDSFGYANAPFPTSLDALRAFRSVTPDSLQYVVTDLFEDITLFNNRIEEVKYEAVNDGYRVRFTTLSEKFKADSLGTEQTVALSDYIDVAVFAAADEKKELGKPLAYKRVKIDKARNEYEFWVKDKPKFVGIDPYNYLIDRVPDDNIKPISGL